MSLPSTDHRGPFTSGYSELQSDLLTLGKFGAAAELAAFLKKHAFSSVDAAFPQAFGHSEDRSRARARVSGDSSFINLSTGRLLHFGVYFNNFPLVRHLIEDCQCDTLQVTR